MKLLPRNLVVGLLVAGAAFVASGCVIRARARPVGVYYTTGSEVYVSQPMPPPRVEVVPVAAPYAGAVWVNGHWQWTGHGWVWAGGTWQRPHRPGYVWIGPRYVVRGGRHVYVRGYWGAGGAVRVHRTAPPRARVVRPAPAPPPPAVGIH
ncbi:MAG: YXWGXW repeat-containing protein [Deltaproteobacteria bacterium]|nr:YXWGXW repeat-containing protein [Deltaproteobacteria bacterium]